MHPLRRWLTTVLATLAMLATSLVGTIPASAQTVTVLDQSDWIYSTTRTLVMNGWASAGQTFVAGLNGPLSKVEVPLWGQDPTYTTTYAPITVTIRDTDPNGTVLATATIPTSVTSTLPQYVYPPSSAAVPVAVVFDTPATVTAGHTYALVLTTPVGGNYQWAMADYDYFNGAWWFNYDNGLGWQTDASYDTAFRTYVDVEATTVPTTTTAADATMSYSSTTNQDVLLTATVSGTPTPNAGTVTFTVKDSSNNTIGEPPAAAAVNASGQASATYTIPAGTAVGTYTIDAEYSGATSGAYVFSNSGDTSHHLTISSNAPTVQDVEATVNWNSSVTVTLTATDTNSRALTFAKASDPSHGTLGTFGRTRCTTNRTTSLTTCTATVTYTASGNFISDDSFTYTASDEQEASSPATVTLHVGAPTLSFTAASYSTRANQLVRLTLQLKVGGRAVAATENVSITLTSDSTTGAFYASNRGGTPITPPVTVTIPAGASSVSVYYKDSTAGTATIDASATVSSQTLTANATVTIR